MQGTSLLTCNNSSRILQTFVNNQWKKLSNKLVQETGEGLTTRRKDCDVMCICCVHWVMVCPLGVLRCFFDGMCDIVVWCG